MAYNVSLYHPGEETESVQFLPEYSNPLFAQCSLQSWYVDFFFFIFRADKIMKTVLLKGNCKISTINEKSLYF